MVLILYSSDIIPIGIFHSKNKNRFRRPMPLKFKITEGNNKKKKLRGKREKIRHNLIGAYTEPDRNQNQIEKKASMR